MRYVRKVKTIGTKCHQLLVKLLTSERKKRDLSQVAVAQELHRNQNWISRLEQGERRVDVCEFLILARVIGFDPVAILRQLIEANSPKNTPSRRRPAAKRSKR